MCDEPPGSSSRGTVDDCKTEYRDLTSRNTWRSRTVPAVRLAAAYITYHGRKSKHAVAGRQAIPFALFPPRIEQTGGGLPEARVGW